MIDPKFENLNWQKSDGLIPVVVQDAGTHQVLMLGYMNQQALTETIKTGKVTFYSRTKKRLWTKGETSGNYLSLVRITADCDNDTLLVWAKPQGMTCHLNQASCFAENNLLSVNILTQLEEIIHNRHTVRPQDSYISKLFNEGVQRIAQKVGEEGVEVALAGVSGSKADVVNEAADLVFHLLVLLKERQVELAEVIAELYNRSQ